MAQNVRLLYKGYILDRTEWEIKLELHILDKTGLYEISFLLHVCSLWASGVNWSRGGFVTVVLSTVDCREQEWRAVYIYQHDSFPSELSTLHMILSCRACWHSPSISSQLVPGWCPTSFGTQHHSPAHPAPSPGPSVSVVSSCWNLDLSKSNYILVWPNTYNNII